jgi:alkylation response protein AidB-like acyl-CoA dehydrogenase
MRNAELDPIAAARAAAPVIEAGCADGETQRTLPRATVDALVGARLFELLVPRCLGGLETDLATAITVYEEVSHANGSAGWCLMAGASSSAIAAAYTGDVAAKEMFEGKRGVIHAGQLAPRGSAQVENGGYRVSGSWSFGSGAPHATHLLGGCIALEGGAPRMLPNGFPEILAVCVPRERALLRDNWHVIGLEGTGSIDYAFEDVSVPADYAFPLLSTPPRRGGPLYRLGVLGITSAGHAGFALGVGRRALDEIHQIALAKTRLGQTRLADQESFQSQLGRHEARLRAARAYVFEAFGAAEAEAAKGDELSQTARALMRLATTHVTEAAADAAEFAYRAGGSHALRSPSRLQRAWRDIHAGTQHLFVDERTWIDSARVLLGIAPQGMVI